ncbi:hypothetical protein [Pseudonocardia sp. TRM90224]|nr:hypothetical protein [Pseudonocardia sp. TRM90224]
MPPAPGTLTTVALTEATSHSLIALAMPRALVSQPPPGLPGAMIVNVLLG